MKVKEIKDKVTDNDVNEPGNPNSQVIFNDDINFNMSMTIAIPVVPSLRGKGKKDDIATTKPIPAEMITYNDKLKDILLHITESDQITNLDVACSPVGDVIASSYLHTGVEEKRKHLSFASSTTDWKVHKVYDGENDAKEKQDSMINTEVSISFTTVDSETEGKKIKACIKSTPSSINKDTNTSDESMFYITKDSEVDALTEKEMDTDMAKTSEDDALADRKIDKDKASRAETKQLTNKLFKILKLQKDLEAVNKLQKKLVKLEAAMSQSYSNRFFEKVVCPDFNDVERDNKSAGDTLDILSNLNDNNVNDVIKVKGHDVTEHTRLSFATNRQSTALSRKELLRNITKAQAALEKSRLALDDSDSCEGDNTLQFDDESISDESLNEYSPLKKTAFGETLYMRELKEKVIPKCFKNVFKEMKELIERKSLESVVADKSVLMIPSTQCMKIQADLVTCGEADVDSKLCFNPGFNSDLEKLSSLTSTVASKTLKSGSLRNLVTFSGSLTESDEPGSEPRLHTYAPVEQPEASMSEVLVFDHLNPLNNILLRPINYSEFHNYNPIKTDERCWNSEHNRSFDKHYNEARINDTIRDFEVPIMTMQQQRFMPSTAQEENQRMRFSPSYSVDTEELKTVTADITKSSEDCPQDRFTSNCNENITKAKKQMCSPSTDKYKHHSCVEVTPEVLKNASSQKVLFKVPVELSSTDKSLHSLAPEKDEKQSTNRNVNSSKTRAEKSPKTKMTKPGQKITMQQLIADYTGFDTDFKHNNDFEEKEYDVNLNLNYKPESFTAFTHFDLSFSSSKNLNPMKNVLGTSNANCQSLNQSKMQGMPSQESWHPEPPQSNVLIFDYLNSLNNVQLSPINVTETHKYNPIKSDKTLCCSEYSQSNNIHNNQMGRGTTRDFEMRTVSTKQHPPVPQVSITQEENQIIRFSKPVSFNIDKQPSEIDSIIKLSEISLHDQFSSNSRANISKGKKQTNSPSTDKLGHLSFIQVTSRSQKVENKVSVELPLTDESTHSMEPQKADKESTERYSHTSKTCDKRSAKTIAMEPERTITAQQLIADYTDFDAGFKYNSYKKNVLGDGNSNLKLKSESFSAFSQSDATFTLSKLVNEMNDILSTLKTDCQSAHQSSVQVMPSQVDGPPELTCTTSSIKYDSDSGVNVVARIDMLPFMGSHECEWETSPADTLSFRLLNGQLRLTARLAHRVDNATRTRVRGDTPVLEIAVKAVQHGRKDPVARMCLRFARETMRHMVSRAVRTKCNASDIPPLLQRCANVVRVVLRWKRAMNEAKLRLAYTLDSAGNLSLKVANIPLRSVWEVTMRIGLVLDESSSVPCPRASNVRVLPVVSDVLVPAADVRRALMDTPKDWGHVPSTIWRLYRLLKHKKRDDYLLY